MNPSFREAVAIAALATCLSVSIAEATGIVLQPGTPWSGKEWAYLFRRDHPEGIRIPLPRSRSASSVALSSDGALVAYTVHTDRGGSDPFANEEVIISDLAGQILISFPGGVRLAWSPERAKLAIGIACPPFPIPPFDSLVVWERGKGTTLKRRVPASRGLIGWASSETLLVGSSVLGPAHEVDLRTGTVSVTRHRGTRVSPDGNYSIYPTMGGTGLGVYDDRTGSNAAYSAVKLLGLPKLGAIGPAFWVRCTESGHALAITACGQPVGTTKPDRGAECLTGLVDVGAHRLRGWTRGTLIGVTADARDAVVARDSGYAFVGENDWTREAPPTRNAPQGSPGSVAMSGPLQRGSWFAFTMQQIWSGDNGRLASALGYRSGTVYLIRSDRKPRELLSRPDGQWPSEATLNRSADLVAIAAYPGDASPGLPTIFVADMLGTIVARFPGRSRFRWSPDGAHLALIGPDLTVWDRRKGIVARAPLRSEDEAWTAGGSLMLRVQDRIVQLDWRSGDTSATAHQAVALSPDGHFSMDAIHSWSGPRMFDERMHAEITSCTWGKVGGLAWGLSGDPFWSHDRALPHHAWINKCDERLLGMEEGKLSGCEVELVDVETMEPITTISGKLIGRTADETAIVVLREDRLDVIPLELGAARPRARAPARGTSARVRALVLQWSSRGGTDTVGVYVLDVRDGDWLPDWSGFGTRCGRGMRVRRVNRHNEVEIEYNAAALAGPPGEPAGLARVKKGAATKLVTRSDDAGRSIWLSIAP